MFPSGSVSFVNTFPVATSSSKIVCVSSTAVGASFTEVTVMFKSAVFVPPFPSLTVYVIAGTVPL